MLEWAFGNRRCDGEHVKTKISITIDEELVAKLMSKALEKGRSVSNLVNMVLVGYFEKGKK